MPGFKPSKFAICRTTYKANIYQESEKEKLTEMRRLLCKEGNNQDIGEARELAPVNDSEMTGTVLDNFKTKEE
jgi:hypothetical protein